MMDRTGLVGFSRYDKKKSSDLTFPGVSGRIHSFFILVKRIN